MKLKRILSALLLVLVTWLQVGLPALAATGVAGRVQSTGSTKRTYRAVTPLFTTAASATDVATIFGSSTDKITITAINVVQDVAANGAHSYFVVKRSGTNTGGTSTNMTAVPLDSNFSASTATNLKYYTANPSALGASVGNVAHQRRYAYASHFVNAPVYAVNILASPIVLRGTSEGACVNYNASTNPIGQSGFEIEWTEE